MDIVSDGEQGKPGFANYVGDRLAGIVTREGARPRVRRDQEEFPEFDPPETGIINTRRLACTGPIGWKGKAAVQVDINNFPEALKGVQHTGAFISAVSPVTPAQNVINDHYEDERSFLFAVADVMKEEYRAIVAAGFLLQINSPDLAMGLNEQYPDKTLEEYREIIGVRVEALNHALAGIPRDQVRRHVRWGNSESPHHRNVELK